MRLHPACFLLLAAFVGCTAEPLVTGESREEHVMTLIAETEGGAETRTVRQEDGRVFWNPGDEIAVFTQAGAGARFTSSETKPKIRVAFQGSVADKPSSTSYLYALYPYDPSFTFDGSVLHASVPAQQEAVEGSFDPKAFLSAGRSRTQSVTFNHLGGGIKFSVAREGIRSVMLYGSNRESLAGKVDFTVGTDGIPQLQSVSAPESAVTLTAPEGGAFEVGKYYHIATVPVDFPDGFSLLFQMEDGRIATRTIPQSVSVARSHFLMLTDADKDLSFESIGFELDTPVVNLTGKDQDFVIHVRYYQDPHFDILSDWISYVGRVGDPRFGADYVFHALRNREDSDRTGYIAVCSESNCYMVEVNQGVPAGWMTEEFFHHSLGMRFTATWCGNCPFMNASFKQADERLGGRLEIVNLHTTSSDPALVFEDMVPLARQYHLPGYPYGIIDGRVDVGASRDIGLIADNTVEAVLQHESTYPVVTGVGLASSLSGSELSVDLDVYAQETDTYRLTVLVLEDGVVGFQHFIGEPDQDDYVHNRIARLALTTVTGDDFTQEAGEVKPFSFTATLADAWNKENLVILAYVQRPFGSQPRIQSGDYGDYYVDNAASAPVGTTRLVQFAE